MYRASIEEKDVVIGRLQGFRVRDVLETCNECNGVILVISNRRDLECRYNNLPRSILLETTSPRGILIQRLASCLGGSIKD